jgi:sec-independent protein translocase protein TatA
MLNYLAWFGGQEMLVLLVIVLVLFGGKKIPELLRGVGRGVGELQRGLDDGKRTIQKSLDDEPAQATPVEGTQPTNP